MRSKFAWYLSAAVLSLVLWVVGLAGMVSKSFEFLFEEEDRWAIAEQGGEWIMIAALGSACALLIPAFIGLYKNRRLTGVCLDLGIQCYAILAGGLFVWTIAQNAAFLLYLVPLYAIAHFKLRDEGWYDPERPWRHRTLHALTASTAGFLLLIALP